MTDAAGPARRAETDFCPYVGLAPFDKAHEDYYFGRDADAATLADNVLHTPCTVLYGPSGVGKTSLINVGLAKALGRRCRNAALAVFRRWQQPDLGAGLMGRIARAGGLLAAQLHGAPRDLPIFVGSVVAHIGRPLVLILDQFEEYFVYRPGERDRRFEAELDAIIRDDSLDVSLLFVIREDRYHLLDGLRLTIPDILENTLELGHLDDGAVREAITRPLEVYNAQHRQGRDPVPPPGFVDRLIGELRQVETGTGKAEAAATDERRIELPYLQLALEKIWKAAGGAGMRALDDGYPAERRIGQILADHLDDVMNGLTPDQQALCARLFDRLVTRSGAKFAMSAFDLAEPEKGIEEAAVQGVLARLSDQEARILTPVARPSGGQAFEIFHDVLGPPMLRWKERFEAARDAAEHERAAKERLAAEAAAAAEREVQARRLFRIAVAVGGIILMLAAGAGAATIWAIQAQGRVEQQLSEVRAASIWSRLDRQGSSLTPYAVEALWELTAAETAVQQALFAQIPGNTAHILKLGAQTDAIVRALGLRVTPEQAGAALGRVLAAIEDTTSPSALGALARPFALQALAKAVAALAPKLAPEQARAALAVAKSGLANPQMPNEAAAWAGAVEALIRREPDAAYVAELVEILKYPMAGGEPTELLLARLRERFPDAKALAGGDLTAALAWIERNYPEIDLDSPPVRPPPLRPAA